MATFLDYARDEVRTFAEQPFCGEDALIFSQLVYLSFPAALATKSLTLQQLLRREIYPALIDEMSHGQEALELLRLCGESPRFRDVRLADRISPNSTADPNRFCAATFILPDSTRVIVFRGTDGTIAGWHEDYRLLFVTPPLDSQAQALAYLKSHASAPLTERPEIIITGHSMGGNLAIYAAAVAPHSVQSRIRAVYAQDSPGFIRSFIESQQFQAIRSRVHKYVPESSMVGMLFDSGVEETVVRSNAHGSEQHFLSTWLFTHPQIEQEASGEEQKPVRKSDKAYHAAFLRRMVFGNPVVWVLSVSNFFVYIVRFSLLDWGMMLLPHTKGISVAVAGIMVAAFEFIGGNLGMVIAGWATDRLFGSRAHRTCVFCMLGTIVMTIVFWSIPDSVSPWVMAIPFMLIAFFIYGPQALLGIAMSNQATKEASATANGILGVFGYASTLISGVGLGFVADRYGWNSIYAVILVFAVLGLLTLMTIWKAAPDGYAAAEKFTAEYGKISNR